ncbi:hypothetical protein H0E87_009086 [Populus deltoides]|uniref:Uncharacterized protein n=1 Tax=Populus deltoides TaxID=3696 RepID=A0A8T2Z396_POPDE|nr:hypothetical protein H0E87_009086 [Populus deltoides]
MCSYTSISSDGDGHHGSNSGGNGVDNTCSKKVKKQKTPKRGPGVAELEKILRDQEKNDTSFDETKNIEGFSVVSQLSSSYRRQSPVLTSHKSHPKNLPFAPDPNLFCPQSTMFFGNCSKNTSLQVCRGTGNGGSDIVLHEHGFLPTMWNSCQPRADIGGPRLASGNPFSMRSTNGPDQLFPSSSMAQGSQYSPTPMINFFPESVASSSSTTPSSVMVGSKRSFPFSMEAPPIPHHYRVPAFSLQFSRQDLSLTRASHGITNPEQIEAVSRDENIGRKRHTDYGVAKGNLLLFGSPAIPSPSTHVSQQEQSKSKHPLPFRESTEDSQHRPSQGSGTICNKRPSFSFLPPVEQKSKVDTNFSLNNDDRIEKRGDGIDLDLRL